MSDPVSRPSRADTTENRTEAREEIRIRWRRYGKHGGKWRADLPPGNGIDSGSIESTSLDTVEDMAAEIADRYGYRIVKETPMPEPTPRPDVPDELLLTALSAWTGKTLRTLYDLIEVDTDDHGAMDRTLRAVVPVIERRVRERVAAEILSSFGDLDPADDYDQGVTDAAKLARGERDNTGKVLIPVGDLAELLDYVCGRADVRVVSEATLDRAFAALKATQRGES